MVWASKLRRLSFAQIQGFLGLAIDGFEAISVMGRSRSV